MSKRLLIISAVIATVLILMSVLTLVKVYSLENNFKNEKINCIQSNLDNINKGISNDKPKADCMDKKQNCNKNVDCNNCEEKQVTNSAE